GVPTASVRDGLSNTIAVGERSALNLAAVWAGAGRDTLDNECTARTLGRPSYLNFDFGATNGNQGKWFSSQHPGGAQFVYVDGSVRFITDTISNTWLTAIGNRRDGLISSDY
ncbi:MAG: DUF1559 domain-containing protein, partial [Planctomycetota bacterium]